MSSSIILQLFLLFLSNMCANCQQAISITSNQSSAQSVEKFVNKNLLHLGWVRKLK
jgi:hypothetical protein